MADGSAVNEPGAGRTLLVAMPVAALHYPVIGLSLLKGALARRGMAADIRHFYLDFADYIGFDAYAAVEDSRYFLAMVGDWVFAGAAHGTPGGARRRASHSPS
ncbi:hypothetical protein UAJ10_01065 [Nitrospirillum sp. BR 11164]|uniref:hypothetical protein n=1 Tax=Nitrospirillum sp. BR 11164 TaxID=3104324 RepID=UPI002AFF919A|nr:hypothetical protein [Nitrospirillum sp. BR 11164]MEA1647606.1 hypothetical protein [Nitrospirillum sp. BR 11164]